MPTAVRDTMSLHLSARAVLKTPASVARIDQRLRRIDPNMADINTPYKEIPLTQGKVALVDAEDYERVSCFRWVARQSKKNRQHWHAARALHVGESGYKVGAVMTLHRFISDDFTSPEIDHRNGNSLDNRKENLRPATHSQNSKNRPKPKDNTSGYKGVYQGRTADRWIAQIGADGHLFYLGTFKTPEDAARAYDKAAIEKHGEFARLNFPEGVSK